jgi:hypothetical protein
MEFINTPNRRMFVKYTATFPNRQHPVTGYCVNSRCCSGGGSDLAPYDTGCPSSPGQAFARCMGSCSRVSWARVRGHRVYRQLRGVVLTNINNKCQPRFPGSSRRSRNRTSICLLLEWCIFRRTDYRGPIVHRSSSFAPCLPPSAIPTLLRVN